MATSIRRRARGGYGRNCIATGMSRFRDVLDVVDGVADSARTQTRQVDVDEQWLRRYRTMLRSRGIPGRSSRRTACAP